MTKRWGDVHVCPLPQMYDVALCDTDNTVELEMWVLVSD